MGLSAGAELAVYGATPGQDGRAVAHPLQAAPDELWTGAVVTFRISAP